VRLAIVVFLGGATEVFLDSIPFTRCQVPLSLASPMLIIYERRVPQLRTKGPHPMMIGTRDQLLLLLSRNS